MLRKRYLIKHMHAELGDYMKNPSRKMSRDMSLRHLSKGIQISDEVSSSWLQGFFMASRIAMDPFQHLLYLGVCQAISYTLFQPIIHRNVASTSDYPHFTDEEAQDFSSLKT